MNINKLIRKYRMMHNNKTARVKSRGIIKFKYVDKYGNTVDVESQQRRRGDVRDQNVSFRGNKIFIDLSKLTV